MSAKNSGTGISSIRDLRSNEQNALVMCQTVVKNLFFAAALCALGGCVGSGTRIDVKRASADADRAYAAQNYPEAIELYTRIIAADSKNYFAIYRRGICHLQLSGLKAQSFEEKQTHLRSAIRDLTDSIEIFPTVDALFNRSIAFVLSGRYKDAVADLIECKKLSPKDPEIYLAMAKLYEEKFEGQELKAIENYKAYFDNGGTDNAARSAYMKLVEKFQVKPGK